MKFWSFKPKAYNTDVTKTSSGSFFQTLKLLQSHRGHYTTVFTGWVVLLVLSKLNFMCKISWSVPLTTLGWKLSQQSLVKVIKFKKILKGVVKGRVAFSVWSCYCTHPHRNTDCAVHVAFVQPAMFRHSSLLRSEGGRVLQEEAQRTHINTSMYSTVKWSFPSPPLMDKTHTRSHIRLFPHFALSLKICWLPPRPVGGEAHSDCPLSPERNALH